MVTTCDDLNYKCLHSLGHLNTRFLVGSTLWGSWEGEASLEGKHCWGQALGVEYLAYFQFTLSALWSKFKMWAPTFLVQLPCLLIAACLPFMTDAYPTRIFGPNNPPSYLLSWWWRFHHNNRKVTNTPPESTHCPLSTKLQTSPSALTPSFLIHPTFTQYLEPSFYSAKGFGLNSSLSCQYPQETA